MGAVSEREAPPPRGPDVDGADGRKSSVRRAKGFLCSRSNNGSYLPSGPLAVTIFPSLGPYLHALYWCNTPYTVAINRERYYNII